MPDGVVVESGGLGGEVPHQRLHALNGGAALQEMGGKGLPQGLGRGPFPQPGFGRVLAHLFAKPLPGEGAALQIAKEQVW